MLSKRARFAVCLAALAALFTGVQAHGAVSPSPTGPIIIGHRGASGYRPEHTLGSYKLAIEMGSDYIEPDLVSTKDGVLVARHEPDITGTTDVASHPEFANRKTTKTIDGEKITGWFTDDFTLAELKTLRAVERLPDLRPANTAFDGLFQIPTFQEVIDLAKQEHVGIYPETKHPTYFRSEGLPLEEKLVSILKQNGYTRRSDPVFIQSFETANLRVLRQLTPLHLIQLLDEAPLKPFDHVVSGDPRTYGDMMTPAGLADIATYADGIGPFKGSIVPRDAAGNSLPATSLIRDAHTAELLVHPYTFRRENNFLPTELQQGNPKSPNFLRATGDFPAELRQFFDLGVDGVFTDNADMGVAVRTKWLRDRGL
jgi:glycerophosphoryl diester phosphodiesterase